MKRLMVIITAGVIILSGVCRAQTVTRQKAVNFVTDVITENPTAIAVHLVSSATTANATGRAHKLVLRVLNKMRKDLKRAERLSSLSNADRVFILAGDPNAIFNKRQIAPIKISDPTGTIVIRN